MTTEARGNTVEAADTDAVLAEVSVMLRELLDEYGIDDAEIAMDTRFHDDLELESIDLVTLSGQLREHYGEQVNFASFIAERELEEIIALTVGDLVRHVADSLRTVEVG